MYYTVIGTLAILLLAVYTSIGNEVIKTVALPFELLMMCTVVSLLPLGVMEVYKLIRSKNVFRGSGVEGNA